ncbi:MAG: PAS domain S-box protein [Methanomassiliicoccales archaeon]|nr:PAS domain S-box protein [Methanomassiliicoccales archaeon]
MWVEFLLIIYSIMIVLCLAAFSALWARRPLRVSAGLVMLPACALHTFGSTLQLLFPTYSVLHVLYYINSLLFVVIITSFLLFVAQFTGFLDHRSKKAHRIIYPIPALMVVLISTDPWLHLYNSSYELTSAPGFEAPFLLCEAAIGYYLWTAYIFIIGVIFVYYLSIHLYRSYNGPVFWMSMTCAAVVFGFNLAANIWPVMYAIPLDGLSFTFVALFFYLSVFLYGVFDVVPLARNMMLDIMEDAVIAIDSSGMISDVNLSGQKLFGAGRDMLVGRQMLDLTKEVGWLISAIDTTNDGPVTNEVKDPVGRPYEVRAVPLDHGRSSRSGMMVVVHDLTQRKAMEQALLAAEAQKHRAESEAKYRMIVDNQTEAIITFDLQGNIRYENPVFEAYRKLLYPNVTAPNIIRSLREENKKALAASIDGATPESPRISFHETVTMPSGEEMTVSWRGRVKFDGSGRPIEVQAAGRNITDIIKNERELRLRAQILDSTHDAIFLHDEAGTVVYMNDSARSMLGVATDDARPIDLGQHVAPPLDLPDILRRLKDGERVRFYTTIHDMGGQMSPIEMTSRIITAYGRSLYLSIVRDTTEMEASRQALIDSEARYRELITNQGEGTMYADINELIEFANPAAEEIFGVKRGQLPGRTLFEFVDEKGRQIIHEQTLERRKGMKGHYSLDIIRPSGERRTIQVTVTPRLGRSNELIGFFGVFRDITEEAKVEQALRRSEAEYRAVVEMQKEMIFRRSRDGTMTFVNDACVKFFGMPMNEIIGSKILPPADEAEVRECMEKIEAVTPERPDCDSLMLKVTQKDGSTRWTEWRVRGIFDHNGELIEYQAVGNDITLRLKMEEELVRTQKLESVGLLAGGIAHDFNNMLSSVVSNMELAIMNVPDGSSNKQRLEEAVRAAMSARRLTQQLLTFSKGGKPIKEVIDVGTMLRSNTEFTLTGSNITAEYHLDENVHLISADPFQMGQVINNVVINAVQSMPDGGKIVLRSSNFDNGKDVRPNFTERSYVRIDITDEGEGISPENLSKIFDPFFTTKEKGSGIGLLTVQSIIHNHGGHIEVESEVGVGTTITIFLPAYLGAGTDHPLQDLQGAGGRSARIMVMDDDLSILDVVTMILSELGYEAVGARTGEEAISLYHEGMRDGSPFDLIIMDLTIKGGMGGKDAIKNILGMDPDAKAIVSSGYSNDPVMSEPGRYGFRDVLQKPYTILDLSAKIRTILNN